MKKTTTNTLLLSAIAGRVKLFFVVLSAMFVASSAEAQNVGQLNARNINKELHTHTWSVYGQGGLSWATGVWYQNHDAKRSYHYSPAAGVGVDFTLRPWVRIGGEYLWLRYRREQRFSALQPVPQEIKVYGNYLMNHHNAKLNVGFNLLELWPRRSAQWLNVWASTGLGYTFARGNVYGIYISNTAADGAVISNESTIAIEGRLRSVNTHEHFNKFYLPAALHVEADVTRQLTLGIKGEVDWLFNRQLVAPRNLIFALASVRYNFVQSKAAKMREHHLAEVRMLNDRLNSLRHDAEAEKMHAEATIQRLQQDNAVLQQQLSDCKNANEPSDCRGQHVHFVQFDHNSSDLNPQEADRLTLFAQTAKGKKLSIMAEASTPGSEHYNQILSERRLQRVVNALIEEGFNQTDLFPQLAIGEQRGKPDAEGRRVTIITLEE